MRQFFNKLDLFSITIFFFFAFVHNIFNKLFEHHSHIHEFHSHIFTHKKNYHIQFSRENILLNLLNCKTLAFIQT